MLGQQEKRFYRMAKLILWDASAKGEEFGEYQRICHLKSP